MFPELICPLLITEQILPFIVLPAVKLNNQFASMAGKIGDIISNRDLSPKVPILSFEKPKLLP